MSYDFLFGLLFLVTDFVLVNTFYDTFWVFDIFESADLLNSLIVLIGYSNIKVVGAGIIGVLFQIEPSL